MVESSVLAAWRSGSVAALSTVVAEDVVFLSPVAEYRGRDVVLHMLGLIASVIEDLDATNVWVDENNVCSRFVGQVLGDELEGVLHEERNREGQLIRVTLFLRPLEVLRRAIRSMQVLLERSPLPA
ncbi:nuclear transport factor 2 family protein [Nocardia sp. X0981]